MKQPKALIQFRVRHACGTQASHPDLNRSRFVELHNLPQFVYALFYVTLRLLGWAGLGRHRD